MKTLAILGLCLILTAGAASAQTPSPLAFYVDIFSCQHAAPWLCIELTLSANNGGNDRVYLSYFVHDINYAKTYAHANLYDVPRSMFRITPDRLQASLIIPAGTVLLSDYDEPVTFTREVRISWAAIGQNRTEIETTVTTVRNGVTTRYTQASRERPAVARGTLVGFVVDSRVGPLYVGEDAATITVAGRRSY
jgi:hypothetical protein